MTTEPVLAILAEAKKLAQRYRTLTGKPLGITGEVAEYEAARILGVELTPGEILLEEFLKPMGISQYRLAKEIGVPAQRIGEIVAGRRAITADTDLRLCRFFGLSEGWWLRGQARYDTERVKDVLAATLNKIRPWTEVVADVAAHA